MSLRKPHKQVGDSDRFAARAAASAEKPEMNLGSLFLETSLYSTFDFSEGGDSQSARKAIFELIDGDATFDMYCPACRRFSVFKRWRPAVRGVMSSQLNYQIREIPTYCSLSASCSRDSNHMAGVFLRFDGLSAQKVGQFPSIADVLSQELRRYENVLGKQAYGDWSRAVGLRAHGIGAGAFVYLRRIIESLVEAAHGDAKKEKEWDEESYRQMRFHEKVRALADRLPSFLTENKSVYAGLSKGVHELDEQECIELFPVFHAAIELMAEERLSKRELEKKRKATSAALRSLGNGPRTEK